MDTMKCIAIGDLQVGVLLFVISLPLALRKVPMNRWYGVRIPAAFESDQRWYDINAYGGRLLAIWSWLITAFGVLGFFASPAYFDAYAYGSLGAVILAVAIPLILILRWSRKP